MLNLQEYLRLKCYWIMNSLNDLIETKLKQLQNISNFIYVLCMQYKSHVRTSNDYISSIDLKYWKMVYNVLIKCKLDFVAIQTENF